jgi:hypothetical protein
METPASAIEGLGKMAHLSIVLCSKISLLYKVVVFPIVRKAAHVSLGNIGYSAQKELEGPYRS